MELRNKSMRDLYGSTRARVSTRHALLTPDGHVPGWWGGCGKVMVVFHVARALGAAFLQAGLWFEAGGDLLWPEGKENGRVIYVTRGSVDVFCGEKKKTLAEGGYAYCPPGSSFRFA